MGKRGHGEDGKHIAALGEAKRALGGLLPFPVTEAHSGRRPQLQRQCQRKHHPWCGPGLPARWAHAPPTSEPGTTR